MDNFALDGTGLFIALLLWLISLALTISVLTVLFPRLQRRDPGDAGLSPPDAPTRLPPSPRGTPQLVIVETLSLIHI